MVGKRTNNLSLVDIELDNNLAADEKLEAQQRVQHLKNILTAQEHRYSPPWLINNWSDPIWQTDSGKKTRMVDCKWIGTENISWNVLLPNGHNLTDKKYAVLLDCSKQLASLYRDGVNHPSVPALTTWVSFCYDIKRLCIWLVLHEERYCPEKYAFSLLDQVAVNEIMFSLGKGGWTEAHKIPERLIRALYSSAICELMPDQYLDCLGTLPKQVCEKIIGWIKKNNGYFLSGVRKGQIKRSVLGQLINISNIDLGAADIRLDAILRQFEPLLQHPNGLLISAARTSEFPSHKTRTINEILNDPVGKGSVKFSVRLFTSLRLFYNQIPNLLPDPAEIEIDDGKRLGFTQSKEGKHTRFIPVAIGFEYLREATSWVDRYGAAIIEYYLGLTERCLDPENLNGRAKQWMNVPIEVATAGLPVPEALREIGVNLTKLTRKESIKNFEVFRRSPYIYEALEILIGASVVTICMLMPSRISEITQLERDCLIGDGPYWLKTGMAKRVVGQYRADNLGKPVPEIVAKCVKQLQRLGGKLAELYGENDTYAARQLFYFPSRRLGKAKSSHRSILDFYTDRFCDFVGMPTDSAGRRWYIRVHEMRKWFLLLFFWSARFNQIDAARSIAGHTDPAHLQAYIDQNFPSMELSELEAAYAADRLRQFDKTKITEDGEIGLNELYERVLTEFNVKHLEFIPEREWENYLVELRLNEEFIVEPYMLENSEKKGQMCIAFKSLRKNS